jgi:methionine-rich copper-binding protein CopC
VSYFPAQNAVLNAPPPHVQIRFSEHVNPDISRIIVVNPSNQEVDNQDTQISGDALTMTVSLPLLPPGTYVVAWRTHSADDGHIAGGSYIFHIAQSDGTIPPLTGALPSGNIIGGAGNAPPNGLDFSTVAAALMRWIGVAALTVLLGIITWWILIIPRQPTYDAALRHGIGDRMRQSVDLAMETILLAAIAELALQALALVGSVRGSSICPC